MQTVGDLRPQHRQALSQAGEIVAHIQSGDLARSTPCAGWDLQALLTHMIGQNDGFATAITAGDAPHSAYTHLPVTVSALTSEWHRSADQVLAAFAHAHLEAKVRLIEINPDPTIPVATALGMHLLDTVIHTWDIESSLGNPYRPDDELIAIVATGAKRVPAGSSRTSPGAAFAPAVTTNQDDPWLATLALLGRQNAT
jgi:uncharacterized protein (TIGR03086 family)